MKILSPKSSTIFPTKFTPKGRISYFFLGLLGVCMGVFSSCLALDKPWVESKCAAYEELSWLADKKVAVTHDIQAKGSVEGVQEKPSMLLYGKPYDEFDRSILGLYALELVASGTKEDYERFISKQSKNDPLNPPLSFDQFQDLHHRYEGLIKEGISQRDLEIALVLGDMGKTKVAKDLLGKEGVTAADHDIFLREALQKSPGAFPSYKKLSPLAKDLMLQGLGLIHIGHLTHLEGGTEMLDDLKRSQVMEKNPLAMEMDMFVHLMDVAGAAGQSVPWSSVVLTQNTYKAIRGIEETSLDVLKKGGSQKEALEAYIKLRGSWLGVIPEDTIHRLAIRIGASCRCFDKESGAAILAALGAFDVSKRASYGATLDPLSPDLPRVTPTYIPAVWGNLYNNGKLGESRLDRLKQSVLIGIPLVFRVLSSDQAKEARLKSPKDPLNFNGVAAVAKGEDPQRLRDAEFSIMPQNEVVLR